MCNIEFIIKIFERNFYINDVIINKKTYYNKLNNNLMNLTR